MESSYNQRVYVDIIGYASGAISIAGILGNVMSLAVLMRSKGTRMSNTGLCLVTFCVYSLLHLTLRLMITSLHWITTG